MTDPEQLLTGAGLTPGGSVRWGLPLPCPVPGVYIVSTRMPLAEAPIETRSLDQWIERVPDILVDGRPATAATLASRLRSFWIPDETVVYIGRAGTSVGHRVGQFYRTPLGNRAPHAGGHWIKTLAGLDDFTVTWADSNTPSHHEDALLKSFAERVSRTTSATLVEPILPFANLETAGKVRKPHGITRSRRTHGGTRSRTRDGSLGTVTTRSVRTRSNSAEIQRFACGQPDRRVTAVQTAAELDRLELLRDSDTRPALPLRNLLRAGQIEHAYQEGGRFWFIDCDADDVT